MKYLYFCCLLIILNNTELLSKCIDGNCVNGTGSYIWGDGNKYTGTWKDGKPHGKGKLTSPYGITYIGEWENNKLHGQGKIIYYNGNKYIGSFKYGKRDGKGTLYDKNNKIIKKGIWKDDIFLITKDKKVKKTNTKRKKN